MPATGGQTDQPYLTRHEPRNAPVENSPITPTSPTLRSGDAPYRGGRTRPQHMNAWARTRYLLREPVAEFMGTLFLVLFGTAANCQVVLTTSPSVASSPAGGYLASSIGWGVGIALGVWITAGISKGHINPAVTLASATFLGFPWRKVPIYIVSQLLGAICGAAITYANWFHAINLYEGGPGIRTVSGTAGLFGTYAASYMTNVSAFFEEFLGTAILMLMICCVSDLADGPLASLIPAVIGITLFVIAQTIGFQTGFAVNPARDFGPRVLTAMVGYGREVFNYRNQYWLWCPILATILGAQVAALLYTTFIRRSREAMINGRYSERLDSRDEKYERRGNSADGVSQLSPV